MKKTLKLPNFVSIEYKRHNSSSEKVVPQLPTAPPRQSWSNPRGADSQPGQAKDGQRSYPRNDARLRNPTNPAWKPTARPNPINPAADAAKEADGAQTSFWVKSLKEKQKDVPTNIDTNGGTYVKAESASWNSKEPAAAWRPKDKKPSNADAAKTWARGKSADTVDD